MNFWRFHGAQIYKFHAPLTPLYACMTPDPLSWLVNITSVRVTLALGLPYLLVNRPLDWTVKIPSLFFCGDYMYYGLRLIIHVGS